MYTLWQNPKFCSNPVYILHFLKLWFSGFNWKIQIEPFWPILSFSIIIWPKFINLMHTGARLTFLSINWIWIIEFLHDFEVKKSHFYLSVLCRKLQFRSKSSQSRESKIGILKAKSLQKITSISIFQQVVVATASFLDKFWEIISVISNYKSPFLDLVTPWLPCCSNGRVG